MNLYLKSDTDYADPLFYITNVRFINFTVIIFTLSSQKCQLTECAHMPKLPDYLTSCLHNQMQAKGTHVIFLNYTEHAQFCSLWCPKANERKALEIDGSVSPTGGMRLYNLPGTFCQ
jgi:hypothetical protein